MWLNSTEFEFFLSEQKNGIMGNEMLITLNWQIIQILLNTVKTKAEEGPIEPVMNGEHLTVGVKRSH